MDLQKYLDRLHTTLQPRLGVILNADVLNMLKIQVKRILEEAIAEGMRERPYLMRARDLKALGAEVPDSIPDKAFVPCFPPIVTNDPTKVDPSQLKLRIELSYLLPADVPVQLQEPEAPDGNVPVADTPPA